MQPVAHTTSRDFLAVSTGALEVYLGRIRNAVFNFIICRYLFVLATYTIEDLL